MDDILRSLFTIAPGLFVGVVLHEIAHGWVANWWGDSTAKDSGRITLNPVPHIDPMMTIAVPIMCIVMGTVTMGRPFIIGGAKPVPINPNRFRSYHKGLFWVAIAGPLMNFIVCFFSAAIIFALIYWVPAGFSLREPLIQIFAAAIFMNAFLGVFNLLPIPPLDGGRILEATLPTRIYEHVRVLEPYTFFILIGLIMTGLLKYLIYPSILIAYLATWTFGIDGILGF